MASVVCLRSGEVFVARRVPKGAMEIVSGHGKRLKRVLLAEARHAYDGRTLLVPGVPEAESDLQAIHAVKAFEQRLLKALAAGPHRRVRGGGRLI